MTGYKSKFFRHDCVKDGCYIEQLPSWDDLIDVFPRSIRPTDIDGMVEIHGQFLFIEEKKEGVVIPDAQRVAPLRLSGLPGVTIFFFRPAPPVWEYLVFRDGTGEGWKKAARESLREWLAGWVSEVGRVPVAPRRQQA